jgi:hypothetical protein
MPAKVSRKNTEGIAYAFALLVAALIWAIPTMVACGATNLFMMPNLIFEEYDWGFIFALLGCWAVLTTVCCDWTSFVLSKFRIGENYKLLPDYNMDGGDRIEIPQDKHKTYFWGRYLIEYPLVVVFFVSLFYLMASRSCSDV